jgi:predicted nucleic acid-binding protein
MKVMLDLNVLLDVVQQREPHFAASAQVLAMAARGDLWAFVPPHAITTLYYLVAKYGDRDRADSTVDWLLAKTQMQPAGRDDFLRARSLGLADFEDAVVAALAEAARCRYIISRNARHFDGSPVPALTPEEFLAARSAPRA